MLVNQSLSGLLAKNSIVISPQCCIHDSSCYDVYQFPLLDIFFLIIFKTLTI